MIACPKPSAERTPRGRQGGPADDGLADCVLAVPPVGEVAGRHRDDPVEEQRQRQQDTDGEVTDTEVRFDLRDEPADDVLVDLVHQDHEPEDPHRLREDPGETPTDDRGGDGLGGGFGLLRRREVLREAHRHEGGGGFGLVRMMTVGVDTVLGDAVPGGAVLLGADGFPTH